MIAFVLSGGGNRGALQGGALKALLEQFGHAAPEMADEDELAIPNLPRNTGKHLVVLRQVLEQRLRAPIRG